MAVDPYSTHLPVLKRFKPKKVLEFGVGHYSTKAFLEMKSVKKLVSVETDPHWRRVAKEEIGEDERWEVIDGFHLPALKDFDLVFVDDGESPQERVDTIRYVLRQPHPRVVIHDAENPVYMRVIEVHTDDYEVFEAEGPYTAVVEAS